MPIYKSDKPTKDKRAWYFTHSYKDSKGNYKQYESKKYITKQEAEQEYARFRVKQNMYDSSKDKTIEELAYEYIEYQKTRVRRTTLYGIEKIMKTYIINNLGKHKVNQLNVKLLEEFKSKLHGSSNYKNNILKQIKALNKYSYKMYDTKTNVFDKIDNFKIDNKKEMDYFTLEEFNQFIENIEPLNYKALFTTLFFCGLRQGEALALTWNDIKDNYIHITKSLTSKMKGEEYTLNPPKTKSSIRKIPIPNVVNKAIEEWYNYISKAEGFNKKWFIFRSYIPLKETSICNMKNRACDKAQVKRIRIHDFRHSTASLLINNGANITLVSQYLGHSDIKMTLNTYSHLYDSELEKIKERLNTL